MFVYISQKCYLVSFHDIFETQLIFWFYFDRVSNFKTNSLQKLSILSNACIFAHKNWMFILTRGLLVRQFKVWRDTFARMASSFSRYNKPRPKPNLSLLLYLVLSASTHHKTLLLSLHVQLRYIFSEAVSISPLNTACLCFLFMCYFNTVELAS